MAAGPVAGGFSAVRGHAATDITDAGAAHVHDMPHLRVLWLSGTNITDAGLSALDGFPELVLLYVDSTRVTESGIAAARERLPQTDIQW